MRIDEIIQKCPIIYQEDENGKMKSNLLDFFGVEGVWALYGKEKSKTSEAKYICLNVGKSKNVGGEILYDIGCMHFISSTGNKLKENECEKYINQFHEDCGFSYKSGLTQEYLYPVIASRYHSLIFVYVHNVSDKNTEKEYATNDHAIFWRNGRPYKSV